MLSPPAAVATQRSLDFHVLVDPSPRDLRARVRPFVRDHYSCEVGGAAAAADDPGAPRATGGPTSLYDKVLFHIVTFASDASVVACARAQISRASSRGGGGGSLVARLSCVVVHSSHRRCGYGSLVLARLLDDVARRGAVIAVASNPNPNLYHPSPRATAKLFQGAGFEASDQLGFVRYLDGAAAAQSRPRNSPVKTGRPDPGGLSSSSSYSVSASASASASASGFSSFSSVSSVSSPPVTTEWEDVSIEYWAHGTARKVARIAVPTFDEAVAMLKRSSSSSSSSGDGSLPPPFKSVRSQVAQTPGREPHKLARDALSQGFFLEVPLRLSRCWMVDRSTDF